MVALSAVGIVVVDAAAYTYCMLLSQYGTVWLACPARYCPSGVHVTTALCNTVMVADSFNRRKFIMYNSLVYL